MGTSRSPFEYAAKMGAAARGVAEEAGKSTEAAAQLMKRTILAGAPNRLRNVGKGGSPLGVRYNFSDDGVGGKALVFAQGRAWPIIERDTKPHRIPKERARGRRRYVVIPGVGVRAYANHPGTKGKHPFEKGVDRTLALIPIKYAERQSARLRSIF